MNKPKNAIITTSSENNSNIFICPHCWTELVSFKDHTGIDYYAWCPFCTHDIYHAETGKVLTYAI